MLISEITSQIYLSSAPIHKIRADHLKPDEHIEFDVWHGFPRFMYSDTGYKYWTPTLQDLMSDTWEFIKD